MKRYAINEVLGGHLCHHVSGPDHAGDVTVEIWLDGRPSNLLVTVHEGLLTELDPPGMPTPEQVLATPMGGNDADAATVGAYLAALLRKVWIEGEGFDGKRPFGNSSWHHEVLEALGASGYIRYERDGDGYWQDHDEDAAKRLVVAAINTLVRGVAP